MIFLHGLAQPGSPARCGHCMTQGSAAAGQGKQGGQWAEFLWGLIIGLQLSLSSYVFGQHCALSIDRYLVPGGKAEADLERELQQ